MIASLSLVGQAADGFLPIAACGPPASAVAVPPIYGATFSFTFSAMAASSLAAALLTHPVGAVENESEFLGSSGFAASAALRVLSGTPAFTASVLSSATHGPHLQGLLGVCRGMLLELGPSFSPLR